jgi:hypothetical protein
MDAIAGDRREVGALDFLDVNSEVEGVFGGGPVGDVSSALDGVTLGISEGDQGNRRVVVMGFRSKELDVDFNRCDKVMLKNLACQVKPVRPAGRELGEGAKEGRQVYDERFTKDLNDAIVEIYIV